MGKFFPSGNSHPAPLQVLLEVAEHPMFGCHGHRSGSLYESTRVRMEASRTGILSNITSLYSVFGRRSFVYGSSHCRNDAGGSELLQVARLASYSTRDAKFSSLRWYTVFLPLHCVPVGSTSRHVAACYGTNAAGIVGTMSS
jgi:hypothetical protein